MHGTPRFVSCKRYAIATTHEQGHRHVVACGGRLRTFGVMPIRTSRQVGHGAAGKRRTSIYVSPPLPVRQVSRSPEGQLVEGASVLLLERACSHRRIKPVVVAQTLSNSAARTGCKVQRYQLTAVESRASLRARFGCVLLCGVTPPDIYGLLKHTDANRWRGVQRADRFADCHRHVGAGLARLGWELV